MDETPIMEVQPCSSMETSKTELQTDSAEQTEPDKYQSSATDENLNTQVQSERSDNGESSVNQTEDHETMETQIDLPDKSLDELLSIFTVVIPEAELQAQENQDNTTEEILETDREPNTTEEKPKLHLIPSDGLVDYATQYKDVVEDKRELIQSAKYFVSLRRQYMKEVMGSWDDIAEDIPMDIAEILLNEFLSPKFTLLEFEYRNLTKAGRKERGEEERDNTLSEIWQKHILGKVLTDNEENRSSVSITLDEKDMSDGETDVTKDTKTGTKDGETSDKLDDEDLTDADKEVAKCAVEIFMIYKRIKWFNKNIDVNKLNVCNQLKRTIRTGIITFNRSFSVTWRIVNCLIYLEILESVRKDATNALKNVLTRMKRMLMEERMGVFTEESGNLLKIAHLFIDKYRPDLTEDALFRRGFGYLSRKLTKLKTDNTHGPLIMNVASHLANEETRISEVHEVLKSVFDFEILKL